MCEERATREKPTTSRLGATFGTRDTGLVSASTTTVGHSTDDGDMPTGDAATETDRVAATAVVAVVRFIDEEVGDTVGNNVDMEGPAAGSRRVAVAQANTTAAAAPNTAAQDVAVAALAAQDSTEDEDTTTAIGALRSTSAVSVSPA